MVTLAALAVIAVAADLGARAWATARVATELRTRYDLPQDPRVTVAGGSFLWQVARGRFEDVTVTVGQLPAGSLALHDVRVRVPEVDVPPTVLLGRAGTVDLAGGTLRAQVPFADLARQVSVAGLDVRLARDGDAVRAATTVRVLTAGLELAVTARPVLDGAAVRLEPVSAQLAGATVPLSRARRLLELAGVDDLSVPLEGVPAQVRLSGLRVTDTGLAVEGALAPGPVDVP
nr:DUF2993 domain-containing protein [Kineococcus aurantiacus]